MGGWIRATAPALSAVLAALLLASPAAAASKPAPVPYSWHGVNAQEILDATDVARLSAGEVGTVRFSIPWRITEPQPGAYRWERADALMAAAGAAGARPLPFVYNCPRWVTGNKTMPPIRTAEDREAYRGFLEALVARYGPEGTFWQDHPGGPVRRWQLWNEPNLPYYWKPEPSPEGFAKLIRIGADAIREADPGARISLGGLSPGSAGVSPPRYVAELLDQPGVIRRVDAIGLHPYDSHPRAVIRQIGHFRRVVDAHGGGSVGLDITEFGWGSGGAGGGLVTTPENQAAWLSATYERLAVRRQRWGIAGVDWFSWEDSPGTYSCLFCKSTGLFTREREAKPSWKAYKTSARRLR